MYGVVEIGGKQYIVSVGDTIITEKIDAEKNSEYVIEKVLMVKTDSGEIKLGTPYLENAKVITEVVNQIKSKKIIVLRKGNPKKNWRRKYGHRQQLSLLKIKQIIY
ncbi:MAG: 50S ribosomal protein L21 [Elusimicrobiota bacterium]|nr:50S ribosomal protein L21 [Endomicrobiia bacterium]MCX7910180.1 50S ribosomal protein L21 [Endomicrobiia bacterium]MDW8165524.1 50S ribosomal protein L21 [Elusimicrobiota bacterium]